MSKTFQFLTLVALVGSPFLSAAEAPKSNQATQANSFTGRIVGNHVRMRTLPDLESPVIKELNKGDLIVISGEKSDFYAVEPLNEVKAYIFRSFIIDDVVEGERVNVRLAPDKEAPVIATFSTGTKIRGKICEQDRKWLEISAPESTRFYIAKEFVEYAGNREMKALADKRRETVKQLMESSTLLGQSEMRKPFSEVDIERITHNYKTIISDYSDFPQYVARAKEELASIQENYLHRKIAYLESKSGMGRSSSASIDLDSIPLKQDHEVQLSLTDRMKIWEPIEESLYLTWASVHQSKNMEDFYQDQRLKAKTITGIVEPYREPVKNKPGDFVVKDKDITVAFVYSTHVNLEEVVGKRVNLVVSARPNNNFAFPAYYVLDTE